MIDSSLSCVNSSSVTTKQTACVISPPGIAGCDYSALFDQHGLTKAPKSRDSTDVLILGEEHGSSSPLWNRNGNHHVIELTLQLYPRDTLMAHRSMLIALLADDIEVARGIFGHLDRAAGHTEVFDQREHDAAASKAIVELE